MRRSPSTWAQVAVTRWSEEQLDVAYRELQHFHKTIGHQQYPVTDLFHATEQAQPKPKPKRIMRGAARTPR